MIEVTAKQARNNIYSFLDKFNEYLDSLKGRYDQMTNPHLRALVLQMRDTLADGMVKEGIDGKASDNVVEMLYGKCYDLLNSYGIKSGVPKDHNRIKIIRENNNDNKIIVNITLYVVRDCESYKTINKQHPELKGKDFLVIINNDKNESLWIPITSVPTMEGSKIDNAIAPGDIELTLGPENSNESKYAPNVLTISGGTLMSGDKLRSDGTTEKNEIPWRAHDTLFFSSDGCLVGQTGNSKGSIVNVVATLKSWGIKYNDKISGRLVESSPYFQ